MTNLTENVSVLRYFLRQNTVASSRVYLECLTGLCNIATVHGLTGDVLILCSEFLLKKCKSATVAQAVIKCMLPTSTVPDQAAFNVLIWMKVNAHHKVKAAVALGLQWIAGLLQLKLVKEDPINTFYPLFLTFLDMPHTQVLSCWLVTRLSKPSDVDRNLVLNILNLKQISKSQCFDSVLWCFKTLKPECVPEYVAARNMMSNLRINKHFKHCFFKVHLENIALGLNVEEETGNAHWKVSDGRKRRRVDTIPGVEYVHFGSSLYRERERSVLEVRDWRQLSTQFWNIAVPCNALSLLQNDFGHHIITFRGPAVQRRFSYALYSTLSNVLIDRTAKVSVNDQEFLLNKLCQLQEFMREGIPAVSRFLAMYIPFWDGYTFLPQILRLLPWILFSTYEELHQLFLVHIYYLFISVNVNIKCGILKMFQKLIINLASESGPPNLKLFVQSPRLEQVNEILSKLHTYVQNLCVVGLTIELESTTMLSQVLNFYEHLALFEEKTGMSVRSVLPPIAMYYVLFSRNQINLERVCSLLLIYNTFCSNQTTNLIIVSHKPRKYINSYLFDFMSILWLRNGIKKNKEGLVFRALQPQQASILPSHLDITLSLLRYPPIALLCKDRDDYEILKNILKRLLPKLYEVLKISMRKFKRL